MAKCSFCSGELKSGRGRMFVKNDGRIFYYCSKKCERNMDMGRNPAHTGWIRKKKKAEKKK